jgi:prophage regulatory protein
LKKLPLQRKALGRLFSFVRLTVSRQGACAAMPNLTEVDRLLSREQVLAATGLSYPTIWRMMREGTFPRAREVGGRTFWLASEIQDWIKSRPIKRLKDDAAAIAAS